MEIKGDHQSRQRESCIEHKETGTIKEIGGSPRKAEGEFLTHFITTPRMFASSALAATAFTLLELGDYSS